MYPRVIVPAASVRKLLQEAPGPWYLLAVAQRFWFTLGSTMATNTLDQWSNAIMLRCVDYVYAHPREGFWVYNTFFTYLRDAQREALLEHVKRQYKQHARQ